MNPDDRCEYTDDGEHDWGDPDEYEECGDDRCVVVCLACGYLDFACDD